MPRRGMTIYLLFVRDAADFTIEINEITVFVIPHGLKFGREFNSIVTDFVLATNSGPRHIFNRTIRIRH